MFNKHHHSFTMSYLHHRALKTTCDPVDKASTHRHMLHNLHDVFHKPLNLHISKPEPNPIVLPEKRKSPQSNPLQLSFRPE